MAAVSKILEEKGSAVYGIHPSATVYEAIARMVEHNCGSLLAMEDDTIAGIITERDYLRKITLQGRTSEATAVRDVMSSPVVSVKTDCEIDEALALMTDRRIRHLPVVGEGRVVGVVSIGDLVKYKTKEQEFQIGYLEDYISAR